MPSAVRTRSSGSASGRFARCALSSPRVRTIVIWSLLAALALAACEGTGTATPTPAATDVLVTGTVTEAGGGTTGTAADERRRPWHLVTLGDAYTEGSTTDLPRRDSWPAQLVASLKRAEMRTHLTNLAERGYSSWQVLDEQLGQVDGLEPDVVTVQVGINDILYLETEAGYRENVAGIFDGLLDMLPPERIFAITTPVDALDATGRNHAELHADIDTLNAALVDVATERDIEVIDIGLVNELARDDESMSTEEWDLRYPSAKQYAGWAEVIGPPVREALLSSEP